MNAQTWANLRRFEGRHVSVALSDGSRIDDFQRVWLFVDGMDTFLSPFEVVAVWKPQSHRPAAA
jgi:hypothetical protein